MGVIKAVWKNEAEREIALVTEIGVIPLIDEGYRVNQDTIDGFESGLHKLDSRWSVLDENEKAQFTDISDQFWL